VIEAASHNLAGDVYGERFRALRSYSSATGTWQDLCVCSRWYPMLMPRPVQHPVEEDRDS
jgi:hypothetical protein